MKPLPRLLGLFAAALFLFLFSTPASAEDAVHIVQPGETLTQIAERYDTNVDTLLSINDLDDANFVWSGQRLALPEEVDAVAEPSESRVGETVVVEEEMGIHEVLEGETLLSVSALYRMPLPQLVELNNIYPGRQLVTGQELTVPLVVHTVASGENLGIIANRYRTTSNAIIRANQISNPSLIVPGQELVIVPPSQSERFAMSVIDRENGYHVHTEFPTEDKWIDVDLSEQRVVAYEGSTPIRSFFIASGLPGTPTVTGTFRIWAKVPVQDMYGGNRASGTFYYIEDVQWVQYFYQDYAFHAAPWNNNLGRPGSRGCINMRTEDARWLYEWAAPEHDGGGWMIPEGDEGTLVIVHP